MLLTANDLLHEFKPATVYTHSDEITLIFGTQSIKQNGEYTEHIFGGRVDKLLSLVSSFASVAFYKHLNIINAMEVKNDKDIGEYITADLTKSINTCSNTPTFDARLIVFPEGKEYEIVNHMLWRSRGDCTRNFIQLYAEKYIGKKNIHKKNTTDRLALLTERGVDLSGNSEYKVDFAMKHGIFLKTDNDDMIKTVFFVFKNLKYSEEMYEFLTEKFNVAEFNSELDSNVLIYSSYNYKSLFNII
jgi:hypothetical protein